MQEQGWVRVGDGGVAGVSWAQLKLPRGLGVSMGTKSDGPGFKSSSATDLHGLGVVQSLCRSRFLAVVPAYPVPPP